MRLLRNGGQENQKERQRICLLLLHPKKQNSKMFSTPLFAGGNFSRAGKRELSKSFLCRLFGRERYLDKLKIWENENRQTSDLFAQNLKKEISAIKTKSERLTDAYLGEALELAEYQQTKTP